MTHKEFSNRDLDVLLFISHRNKCKTNRIVKHFGKTVLGTMDRLQKKSAIKITDFVVLTVKGEEVVQDFKSYRRTVVKSRMADATIAITSSLLGVIVGYLLALIK